MWCIKSYTLGMLFIIVTYHTALRALRTKESLEGQILRWTEALYGQDYDIIYIKGTNNILTDILPCAFLVQNF